MPQLLVALLSGTFGALISAFLSYHVRLRAKRREDTERKKKLALVHVLQLTNFVATDFYCTEVFKNIAKAGQIKTDKDFDLEHAISVFFSDAIAKADPGELAKVYQRLSPYLKAVAPSIDRFEVPAEDLSEMSEVTIYAYTRYIQLGDRLKSTAATLDSWLEKADPALLDSKTLLASYQTYRDFADAAGLLRTAFLASAGVPSAYGTHTLMRGYTAVQKEVARTFAGNQKLSKAEEAAAATRAAAVVVDERAADAAGTSTSRNSDAKMSEGIG